ncbi:hypothetical protein KC19_9G091300 [Ceratodon purpureus]|uniref:AP2/ERF domain-containing protein n=1 Tax=Ceratodon purpureus TaxID=3225 RepID=A0A8T0GVR3_CERPU|nr:hypothetical protein KC19_9G091300 [Ceratodon purpureus]
MPGEQVVSMHQHYMASSGSDTDLESYNRSPPPGRQAMLEHKVAQQERYKGIRYRPELGRYISEIRPAQPRKRKIWLGTYKTAEEAARAFDAGIFYTKKPIQYNFEDSPEILEPLPANLTPEQEHIEIQKKAKAAAARVQPSAQSEVQNPGKYSKYSHSYSSQRSTIRHFAETEHHFVRMHPPTEIQFSAVLNR